MCTFENADCPGRFCVDGFCCDELCVGGRCDLPGFEGLCIPRVVPGGPCEEDDACTSGFCSPNRVCCHEPCEGGYCDTEGVCHARVPNGGACETDAQCQSDVCDQFDLICCNRRCPYDELCVEGFCVAFDLTPSPHATPTVTATRRPTPQEPGLASGVPSAVPSPTPISDSTPCATCSSGSHAEGARCVANQDSSSCAIGGVAASGNEFMAMAMFPAALWVVRRRRYEGVRR
jgi:hypothetical protein